MICRALLTSYFLSPRQQQQLTRRPDSCRPSWPYFDVFRKKEEAVSHTLFTEKYIMSEVSPHLISPEWDQISSVTVKRSFMYLNPLLSTFFLNSFLKLGQKCQRTDLCLFFYTLVGNQSHTGWVCCCCCWLQAQMMKCDGGWNNISQNR